MKVQKWELANKIKKLRSVVPKQSTMPILQNILVRDGKLTATNLELTVSTTLAGAEGETMLIPAKAFGLIEQLPNGEVEIRSRSNGNRNGILIQAGSTIKNVFETLNPVDFPTGNNYAEGDGEASIDGEDLAKAIRNVLYAVAKIGQTPTMSAVCMECDGGDLSFVGLNGQQVAWDTLPYNGNFCMLVPRSAAEQLVSLGLEGEVNVRYGKMSASFQSEEYHVETRLVDGTFFKYRKAFAAAGNCCIEILREPFIKAVKRADMCNEDVKSVPVRLDLEGDSLRVYINSSTAAYSETLPLATETSEKLTIAFNPALLRTTLESFPDEKVQVFLSSPKMPMVVRSRDHNLQAVLLPVKVSA